MAASYRRPAARRRRFRRALMAALVLAALGGVGLAWTASHAAHSVRTSLSHARSAPPVPATSSPAGPAAISSAELRSLAWADFYGVELPVSRSAGPRGVQGGLAWGFSDTPLGALLAAVNIGVRANGQWGPRIYGPTIRDQVVGPAASALLGACAAEYEQGRATTGVPAGQPLGRVDVTEEAFRWVVYSPADATVDIVSAGPSDHGITARAVTRVEVEWLVPCQATFALSMIWRRRGLSVWRLRQARAFEANARGAANIRGELAKRGNPGPLTLRDGHSADSGASEQTSRVSNPDLTSALTLR